MLTVLSLLMTEVSIFRSITSTSGTLLIGDALTTTDCKIIVSCASAANESIAANIIKSRFITSSCIDDF